MRKRNHAFNLIFLTLLFFGCEQIDDQEKYQAPDWLAGKIYTQLQTLPELSYFTQCIELTGYDAVLDVSGSYTVFAPDNDAFESWFEAYPEYGNSLENVPLADLNDLVERHIVQNGWTSEQLQSLDINGWIDESDPNNNIPGGYKRQTIRQNSDKKYFVNDNDEIVDSLVSNKYKKVYTTSRKYAPFFYDDYLDYNNLTTDDYTFYYDRSYDRGNIYFRNAKLIGDEIFAENGFIYEVDQVTPPLYNAEEILEVKEETYSMFHALINETAVFEYNEEETNSQADVIAGLSYDNLFDLSFEGLIFYPNDELTGPTPESTSSDNTVRYNNAMLAPSNDALQKLYDNVLTTTSGYSHWKSVSDVPEDVMLMIVNAHLANSSIYESSLSFGFENGVDDLITIDQSTVIDKFVGSNCTFLGLNEAIVPRAFTSVAGPVYLRPGYSVMRQAVNYTNILFELKKEDKAFSFYIIPDETLDRDSLLFVSTTGTSFAAFNRSSLSMSSLSKTDLTNLLLNHVGIGVPKGIARKEFIENLAGNFIVVNNEDQTITGGSDCKFGYLGDSTITVIPLELVEGADNGKTYEIETWLSFPKSSMYSTLSQYPDFVQLIKDAGYYDYVYDDFTFLTDKEFYTVFVPTKEALAKIDLDALTLEQKQQLVKHHFIRGERIWTDGSCADGLYKTLSLDESSTQFTTVYSELGIETGTDVIRIYNDEGQLYCEINEEEGKTNQMVSSQLNGSSGTQYDYAVTAVVHEIDTVLVNY